MKYRSTRRGCPAVPFGEALERSLAPDGGLYVPESFPRLARPAAATAVPALAELAAQMLAPLLEGDDLAPRLGAISREAFDFPIPLNQLPHGPALLELFHGPSAAFKDVGARFLAGCVGGAARTVLVATSGDTGGAVAAAFHGRPGVRVFVLFPKGKVSPRQERQLTCWGDNVRALAVEGDFDDCQRLVKQALAGPGLRSRHGLLAANSISVGRLLPQMVYYARSSLEYVRRHGVEPGFVIPTGNLGNAVAAFWAREMGFPIREIVLATNANRPIPDYLESGTWVPRAPLATLANAMDVGDPSNMERLLDLLPRVEDLRAVARSVSASDDQIRAAIRLAHARWGRAVCPHTAAAVHAWQQLGGADWIVVATAHPAKFETIVEPLIGAPVPVPPALAALLERAPECRDIPANFGALTRELAEG